MNYRRHIRSGLAVAALIGAVEASKAGEDCPVAEPSIHGQVWRFELKNLPTLGSTSERLPDGAIIVRVRGATFRFDPGPQATTIEYQVFAIIRRGLQRLPVPVLDALPPVITISIASTDAYAPCEGVCKTRANDGTFVVQIRPVGFMTTVNGHSDFFVPAMMLHELAHVLDDYRGSTGGTVANVHVSDRPSWVRARHLDCNLPVSEHAARTQYEDFAEAMGWWWAVRILGADDGGHAQRVMRHRMAWFDREVRRAAMLGIPLFSDQEVPSFATDLYRERWGSTRPPIGVVVQ